MASKRSPIVYDGRLVRAVQVTRDPSIATRQGVPPSTARGWLRQAPRHVALDADDRLFLDLHRRLARLERRCRRLAAILRLFVVLFRVLKPDLSRVRFVGLDKARLLRAVGRSRGVLGLRRALKLLGLSLYRTPAFAARLAKEQVVLVYSRNHTPEDNAATEHQHGEIKGEAGLGKGVRLGAISLARERAERARRTLDAGMPRDN